MSWQILKIVFNRNKGLFITSKQFYYSTGNNFLIKNTLKKGFQKNAFDSLCNLYYDGCIEKMKWG